MSKLFNEASTLLKQYYSGGDSLNKKHIVCKHNPSSATCDSVILGCLIHFYISKGLYTLKDTWNWTPGIDLRGLQGLHAQLSTLNIPFAYCEETKGCCDKPVKATNTTTSHSSLGYHSSRSPYCNNCGGYHGCNNNSTCSSCQRPFAERKLSIDHKACLPTSGFLERINNILKSVKGLRLADYKSAGLGNEQEGQEEPLWDCIKFV